MKNTRLEINVGEQTSFSKNKCKCLQTFKMMKSIIVAQRYFFDKLKVSANLETINPMHFELMCERVLCAAPRQELNFPLREEN